MKEPIEKQLLRLVLQGLIREQSEGEWREDVIVRDAERFLDRLWPMTAWSANPAAEGEG